jgi:hypothetical protein
MQTKRLYQVQAWLHGQWSREHNWCKVEAFSEEEADPVHYGKGKVSVYERAVFLEPDFEVGPGPAFHVYLVPKASIRSSADMKDVMFVDLGGLRLFKRSQRYAIPDGIDLQKYQSAIIWCERFGVLISPADLTTVVAAK